MQPSGFGANGIRELPGGDLVLVSGGALYRVDPGTGVADRIELSGGSFSSGDGLELVGRTLYVVQPNDRMARGAGNDDSIAVVQLSGDLSRGTVVDVLADPRLDRPTTTAFTGGALWTVNGRFQEPNATTTTYDVVRVARR